MGLFHKNSSSKLFASSFAISTADSGLSKHDKDVISVDMVDIKESFTEPNAVSIAAVIRLIRCLPNRGTESELFAVLKTLEIFNVDVDYLLSESARKEEVTTNRIKALNSDIRVLEDQIEQRQKEVSILEVGLNELSKVNECLVLMAKLGESFDQASSDVIIEEPTSSDDIAVTDVAKLDQSDEVYDITNSKSDDAKKITDLDSAQVDEDVDDTSISSKIKRKKKQSIEVDAVA